MRATLEGSPNLLSKSPSGGKNTSERRNVRKPNIPNHPSSRRLDVGTPKTTETNFPLNAPVTIATIA
jgi:hypothetical protein